MPIFLETQDAYNLFQRELPEGVYPAGSPSGSYSSASIYSKASLIGQAYANLEIIYDNLFPQSTTEDQQADWEFKVFGYTLDGSLSLATRQQMVIDKIRFKPGLTTDDMIYLVHTITGFNVTVEIAPWQSSGSWVIGVSKLGVNTIFGSGQLLQITAESFPGQDLCDLTPAEVGLSTETYAQMQYAAYAYSVLIFGYTLTAQQYAQLDALLDKNEPARSMHFIYSGLDPNYEI